MSLNNPDVIDAQTAFRAKMMPKAFPMPMAEPVGNLAILIDRVEKLISLLEPPSAIIITGPKVIEEFEALTRKG